MTFKCTLYKTRGLLCKPTWENSKRRSLLRCEAMLAGCTMVAERTVATSKIQRIATQSPCPQNCRQDVYSTVDVQAASLRRAGDRAWVMQLSRDVTVE